MITPRIRFETRLPVHYFWENPCGSLVYSEQRLTLANSEQKATLSLQSREPPLQPAPCFHYCFHLTGSKEPEDKQISPSLKPYFFPNIKLIGIFFIKNRLIVSFHTSSLVIFARHSSEGVPQRTRTRFRWSISKNNVKEYHFRQKIHFFFGNFIKIQSQ